MRNAYLLLLVMCLGLVACKGGGGGSSSSGKSDNFELTGTIEQ